MYVRGFVRRRPDVDVCTLRFANFMGPTVTTPMTAYFRMPVVPTVLGHDPRLQFVQEDDGMEALQRFVESEPLWRVHECVFGVLALESEPVDPRL